VRLDAPTLEILARRMVGTRGLRDVTQQQLADRAGLTQVTIARLEKGRSPQVSVATLFAIAEALGVSMDYLVGRGKTTEEAEPLARAVVS
jgi:transcriptional regulator with XRE-family HTH domain